jgi:hypothetical protein
MPFLPMSLGALINDGVIEVRKQMERLNLTTRLQFTCALKAPLMQKLEK